MYKQAYATPYTEEIKQTIAHPSYERTIKVPQSHYINNPVNKRVHFPYLAEIQEKGKMMLFHAYRIATGISLLVYEVTGLKIGKHLVCVA